MIKEKFTSRFKEMTIGISQSRVNSIKRADLEFTGLRIYDGKYIGVAGAIGEYDEQQLELAAQNNLNRQVPYPYQVSHDHYEHRQRTANIENRDNFLEETEEILSFLRNRYPEYYFANKIRLINREFGLVNSWGLDLHHADECISMEIDFMEKSSSAIPEGIISYLGRNYERQKFLDWSVEICEAFKRKAELPKEERCPVLFTTADRAPMLKLIQDLNGYRYGSGNSLLSGKQGQQMFHENLTIYQSLNPHDHIGSFFDSEGVVNPDYRYTLVENGVIVTPYTDKKTAQQFNLPLTGSAFADYDGVPSLRCVGLKIKEAEQTISTLLGGRTGILVVSVGGSSFNPDGSFAAVVDIAYLFDGKSLLGRLPKFKIVSNVLEMFGEGFIGVSKDPIFALSNERYLAMEMGISSF